MMIKKGNTTVSTDRTKVDTLSQPSPSPSSSYFVANYPFKEPLFYVPTVPTIIKVPEPKPPVRPPPPGYDMRTLRKQLEYLNSEIADKVETQSLLYRQNEQLWCYIQELLEANKLNAQLMRGEVLRLHEELKVVHGERRSLAEKLQLIKNSKQLLEDLNKELHESMIGAEETKKRKSEAEAALLSAAAENNHLEEALQAQVAVSE